jgi:hypothetical protein
MAMTRNLRIGETLNITKPFAGTILLAIPFLFLLFGLLELVARQPAFQDRLIFSNMGSSHHQLGHKYTYLQAFERQVGHVDCIAIGSSTVDQAFNPEIFAAAYEVETGRPIHCFNFAIDAIAPSASSQVAAILVAEFQPDLLIIGTDARDLTVAKSDQEIRAIIETPWVRYRSGHFDIRGWLMEHAYVYRYGQHFQQLIYGNISEILRLAETTPIALGQTPKDTVDLSVTQANPPHKDEGLPAYYHDRLGNYQILPENTTGLRQMLQMDSLQTKVILVEMPVPASYFHFFKHPVADYTAFLTQVQQIADEFQVPFWRSTELDLIPDNGWFDFSHMNVIGADIFSQWLGHKIGTFSQES